MKTKRQLTVFILAMINVAAICNLKNFPITAQLGFTSVFYYTLASIFFFIPVSLISAELATGWPETGGVYIWVREALGKKMGFLAVFLQWANNVIWYPSILSFTAASFAYLINPELANNPVYIAVSVLILFWALTFINLRGMKTSGWISTVGVIAGTIIPGAIIILLGITWYSQGQPLQTPLNFSTLIPNGISFEDLGLLASVLLTLSGMEMSAVHAKEVKDPKKNYPKAILLSAIIILILTILGGLAIAIVVPESTMNLASGAMEAFAFFLQGYNLLWALPIIAIAITIGAVGMVSTWVVGPTKGLLAAALDHDIPEVFEKTNKEGMPTTLLFVQGIIVSLLCLVFLFMPSVSTSYWILFNLTALLYLLMYILMFIAGIVLRYKHPEVKRTYKVPFKNIGMWVIGIMGIVGSSFAFILGFYPPAQITSDHLIGYETFLIGGVVFFCIIPFFIKSGSKVK
jgi:putative glutamate/gamma-aminobutyrate antiporter